MTGTIDQVAVLARWRETRSPRLADLLCCVPVDAAWPARLAELENKTVGWAKPRLETLPDDPRTTVFLVEMLARPEWRAAPSRPLWTHVFDKLVKLRDVRCIDTLRRLAANPPDFFQPKTTAWATAEIARVAGVLAKLKLPVDDAKTRKLAGAQTVIPPEAGWFPPSSTETIDALLEKVWAAPGDLELRAVIGDALQELGDPRGDLIALQLRGKRAAAAIAKLLEEHEDRLAGPIARVRPHANHLLVFEAGFLVACTIGTFFASPQDWDHAAVAPHWATVERVGFIDTPKRKWFQAWWTGRLGSLRRIEASGAVLSRADAASAWTFERVPRELRPHEIKRLEELLRTMPRHELARLAPPEHETIGAIVRTLTKRQTSQRRG